MIMKTKLYIWTLALGVVLIFFGLTKNEWKNIPVNINQEQADNNKNSVNSQSQNYLEGVLQNSNDLNRGNFKLISTSQGNIYIKTDRDFSKLVGLEVLVLIKGTVDNFELVDIQPKIEKDGYLLNQ